MLDHVFWLVSRFDRRNYISGSGDENFAPTVNSSKYLPSKCRNDVQAHTTQPIPKTLKNEAIFRAQFPQSFAERSYDHRETEPTLDSDSRKGFAFGRLLDKDWASYREKVHCTCWSIV